MAGVEVAGLALAVVPLIISALEHYDDALRPLHAYRQYAQRVRRLIENLELQRMLFRVECVLLLEPTISREVAQAMIEDSKHVLWQSPQLRSELERCFGSLGSECKLCIKRISDQLDEFVSKLSHLAIKCPSDQQMVGPSGEHEWRRAFSVKMKFAFSETGLRQSMKELDHSNATFRALAGQVIRLRDNTKTLDHNFPRQQPRNADLLAELKVVSKHSVDLYSRLCKACHEHNAHAARIEVPIGYQPQQQHAGLTTSTVQYRLIYGIDSAQHSSTISNGHSSSTRVSASPVNTATTLFSTVQTFSDISMEFIVPTVPQAVLGPNSNDPARQSSTALPTRKDLCETLRCLEKGQTVEPDTHWIADQNAAFELLSPASSKSRFSEASLLAEYFERLQNVRGRLRMPIYDRLLLARNLVTTVLMLHATPWLRIPLDSQNLRLHESKGAEVGAIHALKLSVDKPLLEETTSQAIKCHRGRIRNAFLFNLGVLLLEVACAESFPNMRAEIDDTIMPSDPEDHDTFAAEFLLEIVTIDMGAEYSKATEKLLNCDFGVGKDLNDHALQARIHTDVIAPLEELEGMFRPSQRTTAAGTR